jgi:hypothetical protein
MKTLRTVAHIVSFVAIAMALIGCDNLPWFGDDGPTSNFEVINSRVQDIVVYAGDYNTKGALVTSREIQAGETATDFQPPFDTDYNLWITYTDANTEYTSYLTNDGILTVFNISATKAYSIEFNPNDTYTYVIVDEGVKQIFPPVFSLDTSITYSSPQSLTLSTSTPGAIIYYTLDGTNPASSSSIYSAPITLTATTTVKAYAALPGYANSPIVTGVYTFVTAPDTEAPAITSFSGPSSVQSATVTFGSLIGTDDTAIAAWLISETSAVPAADDPIWTGSKPTSYTLPAEGSYTLYAWARDAAGNISASESFSVDFARPFFDGYTVVADTHEHTAFAIGDVNGDGRPDSVYSPLFGDSIYVAAQNADGSFAAPVAYVLDPPAGASSFYLEWLELGDLNSDGRNDVAVCSRGGGSYPYIGVFYQNAGGSLDAMIRFETTEAYRARIGDVNNDGRDDLVVVSWESLGDTLEVFLQQVDNTLTPAPTTYAVDHGGRAELRLEDVDGDTRLDVVVMSGQLYASPNISLYLQNAGGTLDTPTTYFLIDYPEFSSNTLADGLAVADIDQDGSAEVIVNGGSNNNGRLCVFAYTAAALGAPAVSYFTDSPKLLDSGDLDGDGLIDLAYIFGQKLVILLQQAGGTFALKDQIQGIWNIERPLIVDVDGDGKMDVAANSTTESGLAIFYGR